MGVAVTICGGGSLGLVCASVFASQGLEVSILTGHPERWSYEISSIDSNGTTYEGRLTRISQNPGDVIPKANIVLLCVPGYLIKKELNAIKLFLSAGTAVGSIVSSTGFFFMAHETLDPRQPLFGFQRVPYIARFEEYGKKGRLLGYKPSLNVALENVARSDAFIRELSAMFMTPVNLLANFYEASLTNSNPILHTGRLYSMWHGHELDRWDRVSKFYFEWTDEDSEILIRMDEEFFKLLKVLDVSGIPPLLEYYESSDARSLTRKIRSIAAFKDILSPMKEEESRWSIDFNSRYFTEDFAYGLRYIYDLAKQNSVETPTIDMVYSWGVKWTAAKNDL